ncbi:hypothetical protein [Nocardia puris]|uniref:Head-to-tail stopper n=1 Tax=Nocardia puris TaxID=208602 RepID=A0A366DCP8_9NOCA|nr:hypothetical protein [Nocardia puris]RBO87028.1 hypothetical protein DFR74_112205 [Nocardia puris]
MFSAGETVTVSRPGERDRTGDPGPATTHTVDGCAITMVDTTDAVTRNDTRASGERRSSVITRIELLCPPGADIRSGDHVIVGGIKYRVDGQPWPVHSPFTGWEPGVVVRLRGVSDAA